MSIDLTAALAPDQCITSVDALAERYGTPKPTSIKKESAEMTPLEQEFVRQSPFYLLATSGPDGSCDVTPRGDPPRSVQVLDEHTLVLPDRVGNKRIDSLRNLIANSQVGLLFLIPGGDETLRINGTATLSTYPPLLESLTMRGRPAEIAIVVRTEAVFMHCARAFRRSALWSPESWPERGTFPQMPAVLKHKLRLEEDIASIAAQREHRYCTEPI